MANYYVAIDGFDCNGKESICNILRDKITKLGYDAKIISFPDYNTNDLCTKLLSDKSLKEKFNSSEIFNIFLHNIANKYLNESKDIDNTVFIFDRFWFCNLWYNLKPEKESDINAYSFDKNIIEKILPKIDYTFIIRTLLEADLYFIKEKKLRNNDNSDSYEADLSSYKNSKNYFEKNAYLVGDIIGKYSKEYEFVTNYSMNIEKANLDNGRILIGRSLKTIEEIANNIFDIFKSDMQDKLNIKEN